LFLLLLRNCRLKLGVLNEFVSQESRFLFETNEDSLSVLLFVIVEPWIHIIRAGRGTLLLTLQKSLDDIMGIE